MKKMPPHRILVQEHFRLRRRTLLAARSDDRSTAAISLALRGYPSGNQERNTMDYRRQAGRLAAIFACAASLAGIAALIAPLGASAAGSTTCASKTITVPAAGGGKTVAVPVSRISVHGGATCAEAYAVIRGVVTKKVPAGWTIRPAHFPVPHGLHAEAATKGAKTVRFALVGA
jgi:hypothetical protein